MNADKKLDKILKSLNKIEKIFEIESKIDKVSERMDLLKAEFVSRCKEIYDTANSKADKVIVSLMIKLNFLKILNLNYEKTFLMNGSYDKRLNVLIHGVATKSMT